MEEFLKQAEDDIYEMYDNLCTNYDDLSKLDEVDEESEDAAAVVFAYDEATNALRELYDAIRIYRESRS